MASIKWNSQVKLILADVDQTIADIYVPAENDLIVELTVLLKERISIFLVSNGGLKSICSRVVYLIPKSLREHILVSHCTGAEVWGFNKKGDLLKKPFYTLYDKSLNQTQKQKFRSIISEVVKEFGLKTYKPMPILEFKKKTNGNPLAIMLDDRGHQITFEVVNDPDSRVPIAKGADKLFIKNNISISSRVESVFAINFAIEGISKETSIRYVLENKKILKSIGLEKINLQNPKNFEIWGDKFSEIDGPDRHMCQALDKRVRAIDFREEKPEEFNPNFNIVIWDGKKRLHEGLLEYIRSRYN